MTDTHSTEIRTAHGTILSPDGIGSLIIFECALRIKREVELIFPSEVITCLAQRVVTDTGTGMTFGYIGSMGGNLISDDAVAHILLVGQGKMFLGCYITEHRRPQPSYQSSSDGTGDMVVARGNIRHQRAEGIKRSLMAFFQLACHILTYLLHRHMSGTFNKGLHIFLPSQLHQFAHSIKFSKLRTVVGIMDRARPQAVAERDSHVITGKDIADITEMLVKETFLLMRHTPF